LIKFEEIAKTLISRQDVYAPQGCKGATKKFSENQYVKFAIFAALREELAFYECIKFIQS